MGMDVSFFDLTSHQICFIMTSNTQPCLVPTCLCSLLMPMIGLKDYVVGFLFHRKLDH